jgi:signal transduction histidine kinase
MENGTLSLDRQRVRLNDLLSDILESTVHGARGARLHFDLRVAPDLPSLTLDKGLFSVAVKNLLTNAIKYNRPDGSVTVAADETGEDIVIRVADTGIGIRPEDQEKVFDKFFRSSASEVLERSGHGLGLYLAREIVALHHGSLVVKSQPGVGSEFSINLKKSAVLLKGTL